MSPRVSRNARRPSLPNGSQNDASVYFFQPSADLYSAFQSFTSDADFFTASNLLLPPPPLLIGFFYSSEGLCFIFFLFLPLRGRRCSDDPLKAPPMATNFQICFPQKDLYRDQVPQLCLSWRRHEKTGMGRNSDGMYFCTLY